MSRKSPPESSLTPTRRLRIALAVLTLAAVLACRGHVGEPAGGKVDENAVWTDSVRRGSFEIVTRGFGELRLDGGEPHAILKVPAWHAEALAAGQRAVIHAGGRDWEGRVTAIGPPYRPGFRDAAEVVLVDVRLADAELPEGVQAGLAVGGTIHLDRIDDDTLYVGRPDGAVPNGVVVLSKLADDGTAVLVRVRLGRTSFSEVEVLEGLEEGDRVILHDPSADDFKCTLSLR